MSGTAALILEAYPELTPVEVKTAILLGANWTGPIPCTSVQYEGTDTDDGCSHARQPENHDTSNNNDSLEILNNVGFGILNTARAIEYASNEGTDRHVIRDSISSSDSSKQYKFTVTDADEPVKVILSWLSQPHGSIHDQASRTIDSTTANLDLMITGPGYSENIASARQTNEFAVFMPPRTGEYTVTVTGTNLNSIPKPTQNFAIASTIPLDPLPNTNRPPTAEDRVIFISLQNRENVPIRLFGSDPDGDALSFSVTREPAHGRVTTAEFIDSGVSRVLYSYDGTGTPDSFVVTASDGRTAGGTGTIRIAPEILPDATEDTYPSSLFTSWDTYSVKESFTHGSHSHVMSDRYDNVSRIIVGSVDMENVRLTITTDDRRTYTVAVPETGERQLDLASNITITGMKLDSDGIYEETVYDAQSGSAESPEEAKMFVGILRDFCPFGSGAQGSTCPDSATVNYGETSDVGRAIPDNTSRYSVTDTINIPERGTLTGVTASVDISHTYIGDLRVKLTAPDGRDIQLHDRAGGHLDDIVRTYTAELSGLAGSQVAGDWVLSVGDYARFDVGTLNGWTLDARYAPDTTFPPPSSTAGTVVFSDDFESNSLSQWSESGEPDWRISTSPSHHTPVLPGHPSSNKVLHADSCRTHCTITMSDAIALPGGESATLELDRYVDAGLDYGEYLRVEAYNGSTWDRLFDWTHLRGDDGRWHSETYDLSSYASQDDFKIRLVAKASLWYEDVQVDNVVIRYGGAPPDTTPPVITLRGDNPQTVERGDTYVEAGATTDDGSAVRISGTVNTGSVGTYYVRYNATDEAGNDAARVTRTVNVVESQPAVPDDAIFHDGFESSSFTSKWIETGEGDWRITTSSSQGVPVLPGYGASNRVLHVDNCDNSCTMTMRSGVDLSEYGTATLSFDRFVDVNVDRTDYLRVYAFDGIGWNQIFYWYGGSGDDNRWHSESYDLSSYLSEDDFKVRFIARATYSNEDIQVDNVVITASGTPDRTPPVITLNGDNPQTVQLGGSYVEAGARTDDGSSVRISGSVNAGSAGTYYIRYNATDEAGNRAVQVTRTVNVVAPAPPPVSTSGQSVYIVDTDDREILAYSPDGTYQGVVVSKRSGGLDAPWEAAFGPDGHMYVTDNEDDVVRKYNGSTGALIDRDWAATEDYPHGLAWNGGYLYVATSEGVQRFSSSGQNLGFFGDAHRSPTGPGARALQAAYDVVFCNDRMYVSDRNESRVPYYNDSTGAYLGYVSSTRDLNLYRSTGLECGPALTGSGNSLYQSGDDDGRVNEINLSSNRLKTKFTGQIDEPYGMALDSAGRLYVANKDGNNILRISPGGSTSVFASSGIDEPRGVTVGPRYSAGGASGQSADDTPANATPEVELAYGGEGVLGSLEITAPATVQVTATDAEGDAITLGLIPDMLPTESVSFDPGTGSLSIDPEGLEGTFVFWVTVADDAGNFERIPYSVTVSGAAPPGGAAGE